MRNRPRSRLLEVGNGPRRGSFFGEPIEMIILRYVRGKAHGTRTDIARHCNLSKASVTEAVQRLVEKGLLVEAGHLTASRNGGRRRVKLQFNPRSAYVIGIEIQMSLATIALADLNANIVDKQEIKFAKGSLPDTVLSLITNGVSQILKSNSLSVDKLVGIGIGLPGIVDYSSGVLTVADTLSGWSGKNIKEVFELAFGIPTYVENDVKARTIAEYLFGVARNVRDFVYLWVGDGVGAGIIIGGRLIRGATSSAGEIGYNELGFLVSNPKEYPLLYNGQRDFGDILSETSVAESFKRAMLISDNQIVTFEDVLEQRAEGNPVAVQIFQEIAKLLGMLGILLVNTLNPKLLVVGGKVVDAVDDMIADVRGSMKRAILSSPVQTVEVKRAKLGLNGTLLGAVGLVLYELFEPQPNLDRSVLEFSGRDVSVFDT